MPAAPMTPRQRWLALFNRQQPDRLVTDFWSTPEVLDRLRRELHCDSDEVLWRRLGIDRPRAFGPRCRLPHHPHDPQAGIWGVRSTRIDYGSGSYGETSWSPLAACETAADIDAFRWPSPVDFDYQPLADALAGDDGYRVRVCGIYEPFLLYCSMRGMERAFEDLILAPDIAHAALARIFAFHHEHLRRCFEIAQGRIDYFYLAEDLGSQTGPLMGLDMYRRFLLPNQLAMADLARRHGVRVFYHTDGAARIFLPDLIDVVGIDILNPIQWRCPGMERESLARDYSDRVIFHGAVDNQQTLPFGSPDDVRAEVAANVAIFTANAGRYICAPCHNIQPVTPTANILALYEAAGSARMPS